jgi:RNA polymerase sigma factor (sigma-70 family)
VPLTTDDITALYRRLAEPMLAFFARRTYDPEAAVDLVAETFAAIVRDRRQFRGKGHEEAAAWAYGIARHQLSAWYRRGQVEQRALRRVGIERRELTEAEYERIVELGGLDGVRARVAEHLERLDAQQRRALTLRVVEERSYEDVASALGVTEQTARARVSRALRELAANLDLEEARARA